jgi:hypothetical protein
MQLLLGCRIQVFIILQFTLRSASHEYTSDLLFLSPHYYYFHNHLASVTQTFLVYKNGFRVRTVCYKYLVASFIYNVQARQPLILRVSANILPRAVAARVQLGSSAFLRGRFVSLTSSSLQTIDNYEVSETYPNVLGRQRSSRRLHADLECKQPTEMTTGRSEPPSEPEDVHRQPKQPIHTYSYQKVCD